jgi:phosphatidylserine decarboxylase
MQLMSCPRRLEGKIYDSTDPDLVRTQIAAFVDTYKIELSELLQPDLTEYKVGLDILIRITTNRLIDQPVVDVQRFLQQKAKTGCKGACIAV